MAKIKRFAPIAIVVLFALPMLVACTREQPSYVYLQPTCYATLGDVDCYDKPIAGEESRRVGSYQAPLE